MAQMKKKAGKGESAPEVVTTPPFILSFANLFEVSTVSGEFDCSMLFDENKIDISGMRANLKSAATELWGSKIPKGLTSPISDGTEIYEEKLALGKNYSGYKNQTIIKAKSQSQPEIYDADGTLIRDPAVIYSGCLCRAIVHGYAYDNHFKKGVRFNLVSIQKLRDGPRLGGKRIEVDSRGKYAEAGDADLDKFDDMGKEEEYEYDYDETAF